MHEATPTALVTTVANYFRPYLEIHGLTGDSYYFREESTSLRDSEDKKRFWHPRVRHTMLRSFHSSTEGIVYVPFPKSAPLHKFRSEVFSLYRVFVNRLHLLSPNLLGLAWI